MFQEQDGMFETKGKKCCGYYYSKVSMYQNTPALWPMRFYVCAFDENEMFQVEKIQGTGLGVITEGCHWK